MGALYSREPRIEEGRPLVALSCCEDNCEAILSAWRSLRELPVFLLSIESGAPRRVLSIKRSMELDVIFWVLVIGLALLTKIRDVVFESQFLRVFEARLFRM